jgi:hypothetical protein
MTHTPGPWAVGLRADQTIYTKDLLRVATVECPRKEWKANARLIAAAPDLLEALEMVRDADNDRAADKMETIPDIARAKIDRAIAKARGA